VFAATEWGESRRVHALKDVYREPNDSNFLKMLTDNQEKVAAATLLEQSLEFWKIKAIGEIGGAPYLQAFQITRDYPHLNWLATDQDADTNRALSNVPLLSRLRIKTFDAKGGDLSIFDECDWLISFAVDYALKDEEIIRIFNYLKQNRKPWALLSVSVIDFLRYLRLHAGFLKREVFGEPQRFHGWARSVGWYRDAARAAGLSVHDRGKVGSYRLLWIFP
jgi:hypothetical protein